MKSPDVRAQVVFAATREPAKVARVGQGASVRHLVVTQSLLVGVGVATLLTDVGFGACVAH